MSDVAAAVEDAPGQPDFEINLAELAELLDTSEPTIKRLLKANGDFPVIAHGSNGVSYKFDARACAAWWRAHKAEVKLAADDRAGRVAQMRLDLFGGEVTGGPDAAGMSGKQRADEMQAELLAMKVAKERGDLLVKADVERGLANALTVLRQDVLEMGDKVARALTLGRDERVKIDAITDAALRDLAAKFAALT